MAIPGEQPNPYAQSQPSYPQAGQQGQPMQSNPYAQTGAAPGAGQPGPGGPVHPAGPGGPGGPGAPGGAGGRRAGIPGWVWGIGGAVLASAVWAAAVITTGGFDTTEEPEADLAGYHLHADLCKAVDDAALLEHYDRSDRESPRGYHSTHEVMDSSTCNLRFTRKDASSSFADTFVTVTSVLHKKSDPETEFAARMLSYEERDTDNLEYKVEPVEDLGTEAYLVLTERTRDGELSSAVLAVREGWAETQIDWSDVGTSRNRDPLSATQLREMLGKTARDTIAKLKQPSGDGSSADPSNGPTDPGGPSDTDGEAPSEEPPKRGEGDI